MNGGDRIAAVLKSQGVKQLFTLCGGHISPILVGCKRLGLRVIDTRHEVNAVFAADAAARLSGIPGVAAVTAGPGITNSITALRNALMAQSPLILLGGAAPTLLKGRGALQDIDQMRLIRSNVKWSGAIGRIKQIDSLLHEAFTIAVSGVPGPVFLECPVDLLYDESLVREWYVKGSPKGGSLISRITQWYIARHVNRMFTSGGTQGFAKRVDEIQSVNAGSVSGIRKKLKSANRPVLVLGSGAMMQPLRVSELSEAVRKLAIPVFLSGMARGLLGPSNPLQYRHHRKEALREADLVILAGVPCDFRLDYGNHINRKAFLVGINRSRDDLYKNRKPNLALLADPLDVLITLSKSAESSRSWTEWKSTLQERESGRESVIAEQATAIGEGINPVALFRELDRLIPDNAIVVADGGDFVGTASYTLRPRTPLSWLDPGAFGTLGVGGGFALGAKAVRPDGELYIIYGDGSSAYSLLEVDAMVRNGLPAIAIIGNDASWGQIARDQVEILHDDIGTTLARSDYHLVADAFGGKGWRVETLEQFVDAVKDAQRFVRSGTPCVINAILAKSEFRKGSLSM